MPIFGGVGVGGGHAGSYEGKASVSAADVGKDGEGAQPTGVGANGGRCRPYKVWARSSGGGCS
jgi:hypothetical protein